MELESKGNKSGSKFLIIVGIVVIVIAALAGVMLMSGDGGDVNPSTNNVSTSNIFPSIELKYDKENIKQEVMVEISAQIEEGVEISYIKLPDGNSVNGSFATYTATENGEYTFTVVAANGNESVKTIEITNIKSLSAAEPYIPQGFTYKEGEVDSGYIIEDAYGNQFVWIPVENGVLSRAQNNSTEYVEQDSTAAAFVNSVAKNYGFYVARYESSEENYVKEIEVPVVQNTTNEVGTNNVVENSNNNTNTQATTTQRVTEKRVKSVAGKMPWVNINYIDAAAYAKNMKNEYQYTDVNTAIMNSYAWDTTLEWVNKNKANYSSSISYGNYSGSVKVTGSTDTDTVCNICDLSGNVREWTTEIYTTSKLTEQTQTGATVEILYRTLRGGSASVNKNAASRIGYAENASEQSWGFRVILFK